MSELRFGLVTEPELAALMGLLKQQSGHSKTQVQ